MKQIALLLSLLLIPACTFPGADTDAPANPDGRMEEENPRGDVSFTAEEKELVESYIEENISKLSTVKAVLGGTFFVTSILWQDDGSVTVEYEDGHIAETAYAEPVINDDGSVAIGKFVSVDVPDQAEMDEVEEDNQ